MTKKDKLFLIIFLLSCLSIACATSLKLMGLNLFGLNSSFNLIPLSLENSITFMMLMIEFYLIVGCITLYEPKELLIKILPYLPLNALIYFLPDNAYLILCLIMMFVTCISLRPKFTTIIMMVINLLIIFTIQLSIRWLRLDITNFVPVIPDFINVYLLHIDEFIILGLLYFVNRKWGEKFAKLVLFRRNGQ